LLVDVDSVLVVIMTGVEGLKGVVGGTNLSEVDSEVVLFLVYMNRGAT
jgi:hypothetical protein